MPGPVPIHAPMSGWTARFALNLCPFHRHCRDKSPKGSPQRSLHHAHLKARQLEIVIHRIGRDIEQMRERGWLEPDAGRTHHPLEVREIERMLAARERMLKAKAHAAKLARPLRADADAAYAAVGAMRAA